MTPKNKLYFCDIDGNENCYGLEYWKWYKSDNELSELKLTEAKRETGTGYFFCKEFKEVGETGNCGKICSKYHPNNGKNGRCKHYGYCYEQTDKTITI